MRNLLKTKTKDLVSIYSDGRSCVVAVDGMWPPLVGMGHGLLGGRCKCKRGVGHSVGSWTSLTTSLSWLLCFLVFEKQISQKLLELLADRKDTTVSVGIIFRGRKIKLEFCLRARNKKAAGSSAWFCLIP